METIVIVANLLFALSVVGLVLIQHGKGADAGAAFGSGASATVFGAQGSSNFLSRTTAILAAGWFATTLVLAGYAIEASQQDESIMSDEAAPTAIDSSIIPKAPEIYSEVPVVPVEEAVGMEAVPEVPVDTDVPEIPAPDVTESAEVPEIPE